VPWIHFDPIKYQPIKRVKIFLCECDHSIKPLWEELNGQAKKSSQTVGHKTRHSIIKTEE